MVSLGKGDFHEYHRCQHSEPSAADEAGDESIDGEPLDEDEATDDVVGVDEDDGILNPAPDVEFAEPLRP